MHLEPASRLCRIPIPKRSTRRPDRRAIDSTRGSSPHMTSAVSDGSAARSRTHCSSTRRSPHSDRAGRGRGSGRRRPSVADLRRRRQTPARRPRTPRTRATARRAIRSRWMRALTMPCLHFAPDRLVMGRRPVARSRMRTSNRVVVVLPFVPRTTVTGFRPRARAARIVGSIRSATRPGSAVPWWPSRRESSDVRQAAQIATRYRARPTTSTWLRWIDGDRKASGRMYSFGLNAT